MCGVLIPEKRAEPTTLLMLSGGGGGVSELPAALASPQSWRNYFLPNIRFPTLTVEAPSKGSTTVGEINWLATLLAAVAGFAFGAVWFVPLFGRAWDREAGLSDAVKQSGNKTLIFGTAFLLYLFMAFIIGHTLATYGNPALGLSIMIAGGVGLGFVVPAFGISYLFAHRSLSLFLMDASYWLLTFCLMGALFGIL
jgi:hypothetical protein